ncbi:MAG: glycosyltransferase family 2 protein [FCB group bacterium]|jgi:GT2 family glycosyltransferase|nr:glycosyltransferase family 2 protein [FCB group bacterium]
MNTPLVHVLIINWNGLEHLQECFDTLLAGTYENVRYVLVDNASTDGSVEFVRENYGRDPRVEFLTLESNLGWSSGNNEGMKRAIEHGAKYIFLLNNDTATAPDCVTKLVEMAEARPEIAALAPKMLLYDDPQILNSVGLECSVIGSCWDRGLGRLDAPKWDEPVPVVGVCGGAFFLRTSILRKSGLLPEFEIYLDDLDLCMAMWNAGGEIWSCPEAVVRHKFSATMGQGKRLQHKYYLNTRNRLRVLLRDFPATKLPEFALPLLQGEARAVGRGISDGDWWRAWAHARAWAATAVYVPEAWAERHRRKAGKMAECRFWRLIRREPLFFPGIEFPDAGWYLPRTVDGTAMRPMSRRAWIETQGGRLRVDHGNCYPHLGQTHVEVRAEGRTIATLSTLEKETLTLDVPPGRIDFEALKIFDAEDTGERIDIGGWLRAESP